MFIRRTNTLIPHDGELVRPLLSTQFDFEGELTVVVGRGGRHIKQADALDHVAGYTILVDGSVRDYQKFSVTSGKNWPATGPARTVAGHQRRDSRSVKAHADDTSQWRGDAALRHQHADLFDPADYRVRVGLHAAVAGRHHRHRHSRRRRSPPHPAVYMKAGDVLEVEITSIGVLRNRVVDERA
jgi:2-keto-4-pentenoate hydratase/2-oxohepta-3-ene-1,7-dioic acid hydratase in catechol pathway